MALRIRLATADDAPAIEHVLDTAFAPFRPLYTEAAFAATTPRAQALARRIDEGPTWVAERDGRLVGTVSGVPRTDGVYLRSMAVHPDARGEGLGRRLVDAVMQYAADRRAPRVYLSTTPFLDAAIALYEATGFRSTDAPPHELYGTPLRTMERRL